MGNPHTSYRAPGAAHSGKRRNALSLNQVRELLESVDFSCQRQAVIHTRSGKGRGVRHYHRDHLRSALLGMWRASTQPFGVEILLFKPVKGFALGANRCERAMRYILRQLEKPEVGAITLRHAANTVRRPATYVLNVERLQQLRRFPLRGQVAHAAGQSRIASAPTISADASADVVPISAPAAAVVLLPPKKSESPPKLAGKLTRDEKEAILRRVRALILPLKKDSQSMPVELDDPLLSLRWHRILSVLENKINRHSFETWLKPTRVSHEADGVLYVRVPTPEFRHAGDKYAAQLRDALGELRLPYKSVQFLAIPETKPVPAMTIMAAVSKACAELSTPRRVISVDDGIVALRLKGFAIEEG